MKYFFITFLLLAITSISLPAFAESEEDENRMARAEIEEIEELLAILEEETKIATKTKMNADYVPGIITVLHGEDLEAFGARNVWEGLSFVPGIETTISNIGGPLAIARGIGHGTHTGKYLMMLNSIPMTLTFDGKNDSLMMIPMEQVERMEVIRGPGAALYGEFAYSFVVNVITRKEGNRLYGTTDSYQGTGGGGLFSHSSDDGEFKVSLNIAGFDSDGADVQSGNDRLDGLGRGDLSYSPGPSNEDEAVRSGLLNLSYKDFSLQFQGVIHEHGDYFGIAALPPHDNGIVHKNQTWAMEAKQGLQISSGLKADVRLGLMEDETTTRYHMMAPPGVPLPPPLIGTPDDTTGGVYPLGLKVGNFNKDKKWYTELDLTWSSFDKHIALLRLSYSENEITDTWQEANLNPATGVPLDSIQPISVEESDWILPGYKRRIIGLALQDQYQATDSFSITTGLRYDDYDDVGSSVTPRIAGVWRAAESHIFKVQYAEAYRPPTFSELYFPTDGRGILGNPDLKPETATTQEVGYIYRKPDRVGRVTIYHSNLKDMIVHPIPGPTGGGPKNASEIRLQGAELELEQKVGIDWKYIATFSFIDAYDVTNEHKVGSYADRLGKLSVMYSFKNDLLVAADISYVGERSRELTDSRETLAGYQSVDLTLSKFNMVKKDFAFRFGVKNLLDEEIYAVSLPRTYLDDLPRPGRSWWSQVSYSY